MSAALQLPPLPHDVLVLILQHVSIKQRLTTCSLVSKQFRAAAEAATSRVGFHATSARRMGRFMAWLHTHGTGLTHLDLKSAPSYRLPALPCVRLRSLVLSDMQVQLAPAVDSNSNAAASSASSVRLAVLDSCRDLTSLSVRQCVIQDSMEQLEGLSVLTGLQDLRLSTPRKFDMMLPGSLFLHLQQLTWLQVNYAACAGLQHISCLTGLQYLSMRPAESTTASELAGVQHLPSITKLILHCRHCMHISPRSSPSQAQWTRLCVLVVNRCRSFDPAVLCQLAELRVLQLSNSHLSPEGEGGTSTLLAVLPSLSQLTSLWLPNTLTACAGPAAYTAFKQLVGLVLKLCELPSGLWQHLATSGHHLSKLRNLWFNTIRRSAKLSSTDVASLVQCCPHVTQLCLEEACLPDADLSPLQLLPLDYLLCTTPSKPSMHVLAQHSRLRKLCLYHPEGFDGLDPLELVGQLSSPNLQGLKELEVRKQPHDWDDDNDEPEVPPLLWSPSSLVRYTSKPLCVLLLETGGKTGGKLEASWRRAGGELC